MVNLRLENISKRYQSASGPEVAALDDVSLEIDSGEYVAITGVSGSGKSTLLKVLGLQLPANGGTYGINGQATQDMSYREQTRLRATQLGYVFQDFRLLPSLSVAENVGLGLEIAGLAGDRAEKQTRVAAVLGQVGLEDYLERFPAELSGGQQQRVAIARAIAKDPELILADEPTGNLDSKTGETILDIFDALHRDGQTLVVVTHDPKVSARASRVTELRDGRVVSDICQYPKCYAESSE